MRNLGTRLMILSVSFAVLAAGLVPYLTHLRGFHDGNG